MSTEPSQPLVAIRILVYNHAPFLRDCLNGIVMQETTFPFIAVVHDDVSTDGSTEIIREYEEKYPDIIKPIYETENQYSKRDGSLKRIMNEACKGYRYHALCEGDDYWTDPHKLQKQVSYMEAHPECMMCVCHGAVSCRGKEHVSEDDYRLLNHWPHPGTQERDIDLKELSEKDGRYLLTAGVVYRASLREQYPAEFMTLPFGDTPLKLLAAIRGTIHYFADSMVVYRFLSSEGAATAKAESKPVEHFHDIPWRQVVDMYVAADRCSEGKYSDIFRVAAVRKALELAGYYPHLQGEMVKEWKDIFLYDYLEGAPEYHREHSKDAVSSFILKALYRPHYPIRKALYLLNPALLPHCTPIEDGAVFRYGKRDVFSYTWTEDEFCFYFFGRKIYSHKMH